MAMKGKASSIGIGEKFGMLEVIGEGISRNGRTAYLCRCDCGTEKPIRGSHLLDKTISCGCQRLGRKDAVSRSIKVGDRFGRLEVIGLFELVPTTEGGNRTGYPCRCDCGKELVVVANNMISGVTKSCGCLKSDRVRETKTTHGESGTRLYNTWDSMKQRCTNAKAWAYQFYGARGIKVCDQWMKYEAFRDWARANGYQDDLTIDRRDNDGDYEPSNARWVTMKEQNRNTRGNHQVTAFGETKCIVDWSEDPRCVVTAKRLQSRLVRHQLEPEEAITRPPNLLQ